MVDSQGVNSFDGKNIKQDDYEYEQAARQWETRYRLSDTSDITTAVNDGTTGGVVADYLGTGVGLAVTQVGDQARVEIANGIAYSGTERLRVWDDADPSKGYLIPEDWSWGALVTANRPSNQLDLVATAIDDHNYVYVKYLLDEDIEEAHEQTGVLHKIRSFSSYEFAVTSTKKTGSEGVGWVFLADVKITNEAAGVYTLEITDKRYFLTLRTNVLSGSVSITDVSPSISIDGSPVVDLKTFLETGGSQARTSANPLGMELNDLGPSKLHSALVDISDVSPQIDIGGIITELDTFLAFKGSSPRSASNPIGMRSDDIPKTTKTEYAHVPRHIHSMPDLWDKVIDLLYCIRPFGTLATGTAYLPIPKLMEGHFAKSAFFYGKTVDANDQIDITVHRHAMSNPVGDIQTMGTCQMKGGATTASIATLFIQEIDKDYEYFVKVELFAQNDVDNVRFGGGWILYEHTLY